MGAAWGRIFMWKVSFLAIIYHQDLLFSVSHSLVSTSSISPCDQQITKSRSSSGPCLQCQEITSEMQSPQELLAT